MGLNMSIVNFEVNFPEFKKAVENFAKNRVKAFENMLSDIKFMENMSFLGPWCSFVFRTDMVNRAGSFNENYVFAEDYDLLIKLINFWNSKNINKNLCQYRFHENKTTKILSLDLIFSEIKEILHNNRNFYKLRISWNCKN